MDAGRAQHRLPQGMGQQRILGGSQLVGLAYSMHSRNSYKAPHLTLRSTAPHLILKYVAEIIKPALVVYIKYVLSMGPEWVQAQRQEYII